MILEDIMKFEKLNLIDIEKDGDQYAYIYAIFATSFFRKIYLKCIFRSKIPHFWWSEIQITMNNLGIFFEDLTKGVPKDIKIGTLEYLDFSLSDIERFGTDTRIWTKIHLDEAINKVHLFKKEYESRHGHPDLTGTGLWFEFDPEKEW